MGLKNVRLRRRMSIEINSLFITVAVIVYFLTTLYTSILILTNQGVKLNPIKERILYVCLIILSISILIGVYYVFFVHDNFTTYKNYYFKEALGWILILTGACLVSLPVLASGCLGMVVAPVFILMIGYLSYDKVSMAINPKLYTFQIKSIDFEASPASFQTMDDDQNYLMSPRLFNRLKDFLSRVKVKDVSGLPISLYLPRENQSGTTAFAPDEFELTTTGRRDLIIGVFAWALAALSMGVLTLLALSEIHSVKKEPPEQDKRGKKSKRAFKPGGTLRP